MRMIKYFIVGYLFLLSGFSHAVVIDGLDWRQLTETSNFSYHQVSSTCSPISGLCGGSIESVDFSGWSWATREDVSFLFSFINPEFADPDLLVDSATSAGVSKFFTFFTPTLVEQFGSGFYRYAQGYTRDLTPFSHPYPNEAFVPFVVDFINSPYDFDEMRTSSSMPLNINSSSFVGVWLYKDTASVSEPSAYLLMGLGLLGLTFTKRRKAN